MRSWRKRYCTCSGERVLRFLGGGAAAFARSLNIFLSWFFQCRHESWCRVKGLGVFQAPSHGGTQVYRYSMDVGERGGLAWAVKTLEILFWYPDYKYCDSLLTKGVMAVSESDVIDTRCLPLDPLQRNRPTNEVLYLPPLKFLQQNRPTSKVRY